MGTIQVQAKMSLLRYYELLRYYAYTNYEYTNISIK